MNVSISSRRRGRRSWRGVRVGRAPGPILSKIDAAVVRGEEVQKALLIACADMEQRQQPPVAAARRSKPLLNGLTQVVTSDVAVQKQDLNVIPEIVFTGNQRLIQLVGDLPPALARSRHRSQGGCDDRAREVVYVHARIARERDNLFDDIL